MPISSQLLGTLFSSKGHSMSIPGAHIPTREKENSQQAAKQDKAERTGSWCKKTNVGELVGKKVWEQGRLSLGPAGAAESITDRQRAWAHTGRAGASHVDELE